MIVYSVKLLAILWFSSFTRASCPNGYIHYDNSCYKLVNTITATWVEAYMYCQLLHARLVVIETEKEQQFIAGYLKQEYHADLPDGVWIGATDFAQEGEWVWVGKDETIGSESYTNWFPGEPNAQYTTGENCMDLLHHENYMWNDDYCHRKNNFLCEMQNQTDPGVIG